ncbi:MAG TPA: hypothetical protein VKH63_21305 [Candidatus Acidoferrum sp.]|nr:hypothetical protein [Candidatus Acidoferrum sp.]
MPTKETHTQIAEENETFLSNLDLAGGPARGWASTAAFYAALHYVEAFFSTKSKHSADHRTRDNNMIQHTETMTVYDEFCELKNISTRARYYGRYPSQADFRTQVFPALNTVRTEMMKYC